MDLPFSAAAFRPVELLINRGIGLSSTAQAMAIALDGKALDIRLDGTPVALRLSARNGQVRVAAAGSATGPAEAAPAATLAGTPLAMVRLLGGDPQALVREGDIRITGDTDVANQFRDLLHMARPDLEDELSKLVGDPLAHEVASFARGVAAWGARAAGSISRSVGEYLTEERQTLPTRAEAEEFYRDVDRVTNDVERAEARLARLRERFRDPSA